jgi:acetoacetyl-CoA reductase
MTQRVAVVTGGMGGLGEAICIKLSGMQYRVIATYSPGNTKSGAWLAEMKKLGHHYHAVQVDVADFDSCAHAVKQIEAEVGPIDVLVNNAGITRDATMVKMTPENWTAVIETNLGSCFNMSRVVIDGMRERSFGRIVSIGSINGQAGQYGQVNYAAAKSGIHGFTKALAQEGAAKNVTVNAKLPAPIASSTAKVCNSGDT